MTQAASTLADPSVAAVLPALRLRRASRIARLRSCDPLPPRRRGSCAATAGLSRPPRRSLREGRPARPGLAAEGSRLVRTPRGPTARREGDPAPPAGDAVHRKPEPRWRGATVLQPGGGFESARL